MQREINLPGPIGVIQLIRNTADATITGLELDGTFSLSDNLVMLASVGVIDAEYDKVKLDLNQDRWWMALTRHWTCRARRT